MSLAELVGEGLGGVALVHDDALHFVFANVDINVKLGIRLINSVTNVVELLINEVLRIIAIVLLWLLIVHLLVWILVHHRWVLSLLWSLCLWSRSRSRGSLGGRPHW